jgi:DNA helicase II / ATP-dependent DNA helicase PcrA
MPSNNRIIVASAGSGKTTLIVDDARSATDRRSALITYTRNNTSELRAKTYEKLGFVPTNITISTWYSFLLRHFLRPYQNCLYAQRISRICFVEGRSPVGPKASDIRRYYFGKPGQIYSDKASAFACRVIAETNGLPLSRLEQIFDRLYIDECQDLGAYDLELVESLMKSSVQVTLVGDHRQATYRTNNAAKNSGYARAKIIEKLKKWAKQGLATLEFQNHSYRCTQPICDFADQFFPDSPRTTSMNGSTTDHDGIFAVPQSRVDAYIRRYHPQPLRYSRATEGAPPEAVNFGAAKGMEFERVLIYPHKMLEKFLETGRIWDAGAEIGKIYVAVTRARQSAAFVVPDAENPTLFPFIETWTDGDQEMQTIPNPFA